LGKDGAQDTREYLLLFFFTKKGHMHEKGARAGRAERDPSKTRASKNEFYPEKKMKSHAQ